MDTTEWDKFFKRAEEEYDCLKDGEVNRFTLEEALMKLYQTSDDLKLISTIISKDDSSIELKALMGAIADMHTARCDAAFDVFEVLVKEEQV
jgi:hypothetical protein